MRNVSKIQGEQYVIKPDKSASANKIAIGTLSTNAISIEPENAEKHQLYI